MNFTMFNVCLGYWGLRTLGDSQVLFLCLTWVNSKYRLLFSLAVALIQAAGWKGLSSALHVVGTLHVLCQGTAARLR